MGRFSLQISNLLLHHLHLPVQTECQNVWQELRNEHTAIEYQGREEGSGDDEGRGVEEGSGDDEGRGGRRGVEMMRGESTRRGAVYVRLRRCL